MSRMRRALCWGIVMAALAGGAVPAASPAADESVARGIDAGHTGFAQGGSLDRPPLATRWARDLGTRQSYPLVADGRVFVVHHEAGKSSDTLSALDAVSGATLWSRPISAGATLAYDDGRLYALDGGGQVMAFDRASGAMLWSRVVQEPFDGTSPVAAGGLVYVYLSWSGGALRALDGETGAIVWSNAAMYFGGSPAVDGENVYVHDDYYCSTAAADRETGATRWTASFDCWGSNTAVAADGAHVLTGSGQFLDAGTGALRDGLYGSTPAIAGTTLVQLNGSVLQARDVRTGTTLWEYAGDGKLAGSPVIVNHVAYIGSSSGALFAVNLATGAQVWSTVLGAPPCTSYCYTPPAPGAPGMAVGEGLLLVPVGGRLVALEDGAPLPAPGLDLAITSGPDGPTGSDEATFEYAASGAGFAYQCRLDRSAWTPCDGSTSFAGLATGPHVFEVKTTGASGDVALAARGWSVTGLPSTRIAGAPPSLSNRSSASFALEATNAVRTECRLDGGTWASCRGSVSYSYLGNGEHVFEARSIGGGGDVEDPPASHRWRIDATAPETTITSGTSGTVDARTATFSFTSGEAGAGFECSLDGDAYAACTSPARYEELEDGDHVFRVRAADAAGNVDASPAQRTWRVQVAPPPPETIIATGPATRTRSAAAHFEFASTPSGAAFECRLDGGLWGACPAAYDVVVDEGTHRLDVRARTDSGVDATPASWAWTVDATAPETAIDEQGTGPSGASGYRLSFTAEEAGARFRCRLDGGAWEGCTSPMVYGSLPPGEHLFEVVARDTVGNEDASPAAWEFTIAAPAGASEDGGSAVVEREAAPAARDAEESAAAESDPGVDPGPGSAAAEPPPSAPLVGVTVARAAATPRAFAAVVAGEVRALRGAAQLMLPFRASRAGVLRAELVARRAGRRVVVARGSHRFRRAGEAFVSIRTTAAGRRLLRRAGSVTVMVTATWTPAGGRAVRGSARARR